MPSCSLISATTLIAAATAEKAASEKAAADKAAADKAASDAAAAAASAGTYACCDGEHARGAWQCNGTCQNRRNPRECRWFHSGCSGGEKLGDKASPMCVDCLKEAGKRADAPPAKRARRADA